MLKTISAAKIGQLKKIVISSNKSYHYRGLIKEVSEAFHVGVMTGNKLLLAPRDKLTIRTYIKELYNIDLYASLDMCRVEMAKLTVDEKLAQFPPHDREIRVRSIDGDVKFNGVCYRHLKRSYLGIHIDEIHSCQHSCVLIIENWVPFRDLDLSTIDGLPRDTLVVYRGEGEGGESKAVYALLSKRLGCTVYVYADWDPTGLEIMLSYLPSGIVVPDVSDTFYAKWASAEKYANQIKNSPVREPSVDHPAYDQLLNIKKGLQQEHMMAHDVSLSLLAWSA
jgi:hypothetical protein